MLFNRESALVAQQFDPGRGVTTGDPGGCGLARRESGHGRRHDVDKNGRFLIAQPQSGPDVPRITVIVNWPKLLEKR